MPPPGEEPRRGDPIRCAPHATSVAWLLAAVPWEVMSSRSEREGTPGVPGPAPSPQAPGPLPGGPPADAQDWTDEQWLAWLRATDDPADEDLQPAGPQPGRLATSSGGRVLGTAMLGLAQAMYGPRRDEIVIEQERPTDPPGDDEVEVHLDTKHPERSTAIVRRHR